MVTGTLERLFAASVEAVTCAALAGEETSWAGTVLPEANVANVVTPAVAELTVDLVAGEVTASGDVGLGVVVSRPEGEDEADDETDETEVEWTVDCEGRGFSNRYRANKENAGVCSLTEAALGGWTCPEPEETQPGGTDVDLTTAEESVVGTHGHTLGVTKLEVSRCVPLQGTGS